MADGDLVRSVRSAGQKHVGAASMMLLVPSKTFEVSSSEGWSASTRLFRPSAMRMTRRSLQEPECNFLFLQRCRCKC